MISMAALACGLDVFTQAKASGGMAALRRKSLALTDLFIALVNQRCAGHGLSLETPLNHAERGSQVCLGRQTGAYAIVQALIARGVIGDFRAGSANGDIDILRFGFTPLYLGFVDVWNAVEQLYQVLQTGQWQQPQFNQTHAVT
jgi:kynureninase